MAVITRYVVVRNDEDVMTFTDKKAADDYDKMLDMADAMSEFISSSKIELSAETVEELSIYLASHRDEVLYCLNAKKRPTVKSAAKVKTTNKAKAEASD